MSIEIRKFRRVYDLELITVSTPNITLGTLIWDPILGKPQLDAGGMANNILNIFLSTKLITKAEWQQNLDQFASTPLVQAAFAERIVDVDVDFITNLSHPVIGKLAGAYNLDSVKKFSFGELSARVMSDLMRVQLDEYLENLKKNHWADYDGKVRRVFLITELYYGSLKLIIEKKMSGNFEGSIKKTDLTIQEKFEMNESVEYTFSHKDLPFAMRIEKVRTFKG